jgi:hypothetical protein
MSTDIEALRAVMRCCMLAVSPHLLYINHTNLGILFLVDDDRMMIEEHDLFCCSLCTIQPSDQ